MHSYLLVATLLIILLTGCQHSTENKKANYKALAEQYFKRIYSCDLSGIDELVSEDIVVSYPIFEKILNKRSIQGRQAVWDFNAGFCQRWTDMHITIHESIAENNQVVLIWSYQAKNIGSAIQGQEPSNKEESWGGITLIPGLMKQERSLQKLARKALRVLLNASCNSFHRCSIIMAIMLLIIHPEKRYIF